jgi:deoxyribodipyrimidine photolyase-related protein
VSRSPVFAARLAAVAPSGGTRRWIYVPYDQLNGDLGPLAEQPPRETGIVLVETPEKAVRRPYHVQKLALVLANQRHFALEQVARGVAVRYLVAGEGLAATLRRTADEVGPLACMQPAERELREELAPLVVDGALRVTPHDGWLTTRAQFEAACGAEPPWRMDAFYRHVRRETGVLMTGGKPVGGRFSFDGENREPWRGEPAPPVLPRFEPDEITREVGELVAAQFAEHPGRLDLTTLPATAADAAKLWAWARAACLTHFGPFEDAMTTRSRGLFHTRISPLLNLQRLRARDILQDVLDADIPLNSKEGFVRQLLGWREFVRHVHDATDGFRTIEPNGRPSELGVHEPLPQAWWGTPSGLRCLDSVVASVVDEGWSHHITRLMILANLAVLLDVEPRELTDWFWAMYVDAFDWVVEPNVLGMGTFGAGEVMTTKPYVSGAAYIHRMSDYCGSCAFHPRRNCPITDLYWSFLSRHAAELGGNRRMGRAIASLRKRDPARSAADERVFRHVTAELRAGRALTPEGVAAARQNGA